MSVLGIRDILQAVTKTLETLAAKGLVKEKAYGKQKVYVFSQVQTNLIFYNQHFSSLSSDGIWKPPITCSFPLLYM